ncbi:hypothetical protein [Dactylosporangium sp. NPDC051484]|uniref:acyltransferase family protein n=1 Tax=Dactylosporangium sp. NPDC051484 TaxID=3154942 RepID=UPI00344FD428
MRALSVLAVLVFHANPDWLPGGFLGVDAFYVLSGFLITGLLLAELRTTGRIALAAFWGRRARRLLPALLVAQAAPAAGGPLPSRHPHRSEEPFDEVAMGDRRRRGRARPDRGARGRRRVAVSPSAAGPLGGRA